MSYIPEEESYHQERDYRDIDVEADRVIAMNSSGVVEKFENGKKLTCNGDMCVLEDHDVGISNQVNESDDVKSSSASTPVASTSTSYYTYILYFVIFLVICALGYFGYKKFVCKE